MKYASLAKHWQVAIISCIAIAFMPCTYFDTQDYQSYILKVYIYIYAYIQKPNHM